MTAQDYYDQLPADRKQPMENIRKVLLNNLPDGFKEGFGYGMPSYIVPLSRYPAGYHCAPGTPLAYISLASQKNFIAMHHLGMYASPELTAWFAAEYPKHSKSKLDMGKGCIRFKKMDDIPYELIAKMAQKLTVQQWIDTYERILKK